MYGADDEGAFLRAMIENPDDAALGQVFADWLEERGDPRAKYFRRVLMPYRSGDFPPDLTFPDHPGETVFHFQGAMWSERDGGWVCEVFEEYHVKTQDGRRRTGRATVEKASGVAEADLPLAVRAALRYRHWPRKPFFPGVHSVGIIRQLMTKRPWSYCLVCKGYLRRDGRDEYLPSYNRMTKKLAEERARVEADWYRAEYIGEIESEWGWFLDGGRPMV